METNQELMEKKVEADGVVAQAMPTVNSGDNGDHQANASQAKLTGSSARDGAEDWSPEAAIESGADLEEVVEKAIRIQVFGLLRAAGDDEPRRYRALAEMQKFAKLLEQKRSRKERTAAQQRRLDLLQTAQEMKLRQMEMDFEPSDETIDCESEAPEIMPSQNKEEKPGAVQHLASGLAPEPPRPEPATPSPSEREAEPEQAAPQRVYPKPDFPAPAVPSSGPWIVRVDVDPHYR